MNTRTKNDKESGRLVSNGRPGYVTIPFFANLVVALVLIFLALENFATGGSSLSTFQIGRVIFALVFLGADYGIWLRKRVAFAVSIGASTLLLLLEAPRIPELWGVSTAISQFYPSLVGLSVAFLSLLSSILGFKAVRRKGDIISNSWKMTASTAIALLVIGFIIGGMFVGAFTASTESRLLANSGSGAQITIPQGASNPNSAQFYSPSTLTVTVGTTVTWINNDVVTHTVTSLGSDLFNSGNMPTGATFSFTFIQPGTYQYYCTIHPFMKGTIIVTNS